MYRGKVTPQDELTDIISDEASPAFLERASAKGDLDTLKEELGLDQINAVGKNGSSYLMRAAGGNHVEMIQWLLDNKADANLVNRRGHNALMIACAAGHVEAARLLATISDRHCRNENGNSAEMLATEGGHLEVLKALDEIGQRTGGPVGMWMGEVNKAHKNCLMLACEYGRHDIVQWLVEEKGCNPNAKTPAGLSALSLAVRHTQRWPQPMSTSASQQDSSTPEQRLQVQQHKNSIRILVERAAAVTATTQLDIGMDMDESVTDSPLIWAAKAGNSYAIMQLIQRGSPVPGIALVFAAGTDSVEAVKLLLEALRKSRPRLFHFDSINSLKESCVGRALHTSWMRGNYKVGAFLLETLEREHQSILQEAKSKVRPEARRGIRMDGDEFYSTGAKMWEMLFSEQDWEHITKYILIHRLHEFGDEVASQPENKFYFDLFMRMPPLLHDCSVSELRCYVSAFYRILERRKDDSELVKHIVKFIADFKRTAHKHTQFRHSYNLFIEEAESVIQTCFDSGCMDEDIVRRILLCSNPEAFSYANENVNKAQAFYTGPIPLCLDRNISSMFCSGFVLVYLESLFWSSLRGVESRHARLRLCRKKERGQGAAVPQSWSTLGSVTSTNTNTNTNTNPITKNDGTIHTGVATATASGPGTAPTVLANATNKASGDWESVGVKEGQPLLNSDSSKTKSAHAHTHTHTHHEVVEAEEVWVDCWEANVRRRVESFLLCLWSSLFSATSKLQLRAIPPQMKELHSELIYWRYSPVCMNMSIGVSKLILLVCTALVGINVRDNPVAYAVSDNSGVTPEELALLLMLVSSGLFEYGEMCGHSLVLIPDIPHLRKYCRDRWNMFDMSALILVTIWVTFTYGHFVFDSATHITIAQGCLSVSLIFSSFGLLRFFAVIQPVGKLTIMLQSMIGELASFAVVFVICVNGFCLALYCLMTDHSAYLSVSDVILSQFSITLSNVDFSAMQGGRFSSLTVVIELLFSALAAIVLINLVIARMTATHDRVNKKSDQLWQFQRAVTLKGSLLINESNPFSMLPPPFNLITAALWPIHAFHLRGFQPNVSARAFARRTSGIGSPNFKNASHKQNLFTPSRRKVSKRLSIAGTVSDKLIGVVMAFVAPCIELVKFLWGMQLWVNGPGQYVLGLLGTLLIFPLFVYPLFVFSLLMDVIHTNTELVCVEDGEGNLHYGISYPEIDHENISKNPKLIDLKKSATLVVNILGGSNLQNCSDTNDLYVRFRLGDFEQSTTRANRAGSQPVWWNQQVLTLPLVRPEHQRSTVMRMEVVEMDVDTGSVRVLYERSSPIQMPLSPTSPPPALHSSGADDSFDLTKWIDCGGFEGDVEMVECQQRDNSSELGSTFARLQKLFSYCFSWAVDGENIIASSSVSGKAPVDSSPPSHHSLSNNKKKANRSKKSSSKKRLTGLKIEHTSGTPLRPSEVIQIHRDSMDDSEDRVVSSRHDGGNDVDDDELLDEEDDEEFDGSDGGVNGLVPCIQITVQCNVDSDSSYLLEKVKIPNTLFAITVTPLILRFAMTPLLELDFPTKFRPPEDF